MDCLTEPGCNLCCKLIGVKPLQKPKYRMCAHACKGGGCQIYQDRPDECKVFECLWLHMQGTDTPMTSSLKPSACGAVMYPSPVGDAIAIHINDGVDWRRGALGQFIKTMSYQITILIRHRYTMWVVRDNIVVGEDRNFAAGQDDQDVVHFSIEKLPIHAMKVAVR